MKWEFNESVASTFKEHAKIHIPNYELVIEKSIGVCKKYPNNARIIDVGCAIGETLTSLNLHGFTNLVGVDNSQFMLNECPKNIAELILNSEFPTDQGPYDVVISNWTLHFIKKKREYLEKIFESLNSHGSLILTDKTTKDPEVICYYHDMKLKNGATQEDVKKKEESIKDIMFLDDPSWYLSTLQNIGFSKVFIIDASWCFTTFLALK
jgi:trans-aconitate methyltransferase